MSEVIVLNATYQPLQTVTLKHAIGMLWRGVAVAIEEGPEMFGPYLVPRVLLLVRYVKESWRYGKRSRPGAASPDGTVKVTWGQQGNPAAVFSKESLLVRDGSLCAYCLYTATTFDHVFPKSRGGASEWGNALAACADCNEFKADRTPEEAGLVPFWEPWVPTVQDLMFGKPSPDRFMVDA